MYECSRRCDSFLCCTGILVETGRNLFRDMEEIVSTIGTLALQGMTIDQVVSHLQKEMTEDIRAMNKGNCSFVRNADPAMKTAFIFSRLRFSGDGVAGSMSERIIWMIPRKYLTCNDLAN